MHKQLWQLLIHDGEEALSCKDCFAILEYLADLNDSQNIDRKTLIRAARRHLQACPDCQAYYQHRLDELENSYGAGGKTTDDRAV